MMVDIVINRVAQTLTDAQLLGEGGEATVYDLGNATVAKIWKTQSHPDFAGDSAAQENARLRCEHLPAKLRDLPALPNSVAVPLASVVDRQGKQIGFVMRNVVGETLHRFGEARFCANHRIDRNQAVAMLHSLHSTVTAVHQAGLVIGDFNDCNVISDGHSTVLIDVDSFRFSNRKYDQLPVAFCERFIDPRLCRATSAGIGLVAAPDMQSDWFAFCVIALRTLLFIGPWGGSSPLTPSQRLLARTTVFDPSVVYPKAALPLQCLPDWLLQHFAAVFTGASAAKFPVQYLSDLTFQTCPNCNKQTASKVCTCGGQVPKATRNVTVAHQVSTLPVTPPDCTWYPVSTDDRKSVWLTGGQLYRRRGSLIAPFGAVVGLHWVFATEQYGIGCYRVGNLLFPLQFDTNAGLVVEHAPVALPPCKVIAVDPVFSDDGASGWLVITLANDGAISEFILAISKQRVEACHPSVPQVSVGWSGACGVGDLLLVPTDDGVARYRMSRGVLSADKVFTATKPFVHSGCRLTQSNNGLVVVDPNSPHHALAIRMIP